MDKNVHVDYKLLFSLLDELLFIPRGKWLVELSAINQSELLGKEKKKKKTSKYIKLSQLQSANQDVN